MINRGGPGDRKRYPTELMRVSFISLLCTVAMLGCERETDRRVPWISQSINLEETVAITIVFDGGLIQDGGTIELYAVTESGFRCSIRLNQRSLYGDYRLNSPDSPGRLCFNDRLIDVRSADEQKVLELLKDAKLIAVDIEGLRQLAKIPRIETAHLQSLASDSPNPFLRKFRDAIVDYVESERYVDVAHNGLQLPPETNG